MQAAHYGTLSHPAEAKLVLPLDRGRHSTWIRERDALGDVRLPAAAAIVSPCAWHAGPHLARSHCVMHKAGQQSDVMQAALPLLNHIPIGSIFFLHCNACLPPSVMEKCMLRARIISADSPMVEPGDLWTRRLPGAFCNRSPHVRPREGGGGLVFVPSQKSPFNTRSTSARSTSIS